MLVSTRNTTAIDKNLLSKLVHTYELLIEERTERDTDDKIWFYEVRADGYDLNKIVDGGRPETPERNNIPDLLNQWRSFKASGYADPPGIEASTLLEPGSDEPRCWWATVETLAQKDYNLTAGRYKPLIAEPVPDDDSADLIREVLHLEREIAKDLEALLREVEADVHASEETRAP